MKDNQPSVLQQLDDVLDILSEVVEHSDGMPYYTVKPHTESEIKTELTNRGTSMPTTDLLLVLKHLHTEGYISPFDVNPEPYYTVTFAGRVFNERGGYVAKNESKIARANRLEALETHQRELTERSLYVNTWIMRATIGAAIATSLYLVWTVLAYGIDHSYKCSCY